MANILDQLNIPPAVREFLQKGRMILVGVGVVILAFGSIVTIEPEEVGVITRFGQYIRTIDPGLNFKIPFFESVYKVPIERQQKLEFGFRTTNADVRTEYTRGGGVKGESLMLTGDLNLADVEWVVQYRIQDPYQYLFKAKNPVTTLRDISESAMRQVVGDRTVNEVLTVGRAEIAAELEVLVQDICNDYTLGVAIDQIVLQDVNPPDAVKNAFNAVNQAQQEKETLINQARSEYNKVIPKAKGQAQETIQKAEGYATERINNARGEVVRFTEIYKEYVKAPEVTRKRIYLETMGDVIPKLENVIITDPEAQNVLPLLQMQMKKGAQQP